MPRALLRKRFVSHALIVASVACALVLAAAGPAFAGVLTPESGGSPNADNIHGLYVIVLVVAIIVLFGVEGTLLYSVIRFRKRRGAVAAQIHGNTRVEIGWTIGAAVIVVVLSLVTFVKLSSINDPAATGANGLTPVAGGAIVASVDQPPPPGGQGLTIDVNGQQYIWRYTYPGGAFSYEEMVAPVDTTVILRIRSQDVDHSWWIPELGPKFDAIPGYTNKSWFKIPGDKAGSIFYGQCSELCGRNHANMVARVRAVTPAQYRSFIICQKALIKQAQQATIPANRRKPPAPPPPTCANSIAN
jgi:cytochrome c oxidase subunit 2